MTCAQVVQWLRRDLDGVAEPSAEVATHLERCDRCRAEAARLKQLAGAARDALPQADVPLDFAERVMATLVEPSADAALARAARPRLRRWLPAVAAALLLIPLLPLLAPDPVATGDLKVERDGAWVAADGARVGETFGLEAYARVEVVGLEVAALRASLLRATDRLELLAGEVRIETAAPAVIKTPLGEIRMREQSACLATIENATEDSMSFTKMKSFAPAALAVTLIAGGAIVANAEGDEKAEKKKIVKVVRGEKPVAVDEDFAREMKRLSDLVTEANEIMARVRVDAERRVDVELRRALAALDQANQNLAELKAKLRQDPRRPVAVEDIVEEVPAEAIEPVEIAEFEDGDPIIAKRGRGGDVKVLLARARGGDRAAKDELRKLMAQIRAVMEVDEVATWEEARKSIEDIESLRAARALRELEDRVKRAEAAMKDRDANLDLEIRRRSEAQAKILQIKELQESIARCDRKIDHCTLAQNWPAVDSAKKSRELLRRKLEAVIVGKKKKKVGEHMYGPGIR